MSKAYPLKNSEPKKRFTKKGRGVRYAVFFSRYEPAIRVSRKNAKETREVCDSIQFGTPNRKKLIYQELKKRGIIK
jgi:hypothetical protein